MLIWLVLGILLGAGVVYLRRQNAIKLAWFDWVLLVAAVVFYVLAIQNYTGSMEELEPRAAMFLLASFGVPALILTAIVAIRAWRSKQQSPASQAGATS